MSSNETALAARVKQLEAQLAETHTALELTRRHLVFLLVASKDWLTFRGTPRDLPDRIEEVEEFLLSAVERIGPCPQP